MPVAYVVAGIFICFTLLVLVADVVNPVRSRWIVRPAAAGDGRGTLRARLPYFGWFTGRDVLDAVPVP